MTLAEFLNALKALSNIADDDIRADDPTGTPAHIFYFTWTDEERDDEIEVVSNRLLPWIEPVVTGTLTPVGYTQQVKLIQFPRVMATTFTRATSPVVSITETRVGAIGANAEQTIVVPSTATGSVSFTWAGSATKTIAVAALTASGIAEALNAIVADGTSNPSFRCEARETREGRRFAVEFIGPLAAQNVGDLTATMHDQEAVLYASGTLDLGGLGLEQALNGEEEITMWLEVVITAGGGEETFLREVVIVNDMTSGATETSASQLGAIEVVETEVLVDSGLGTPFAEASPGLVFTPPATGAVFTIEHSLGTNWPSVRVFHRVAESPDEWKQIPDNEFLAVALDEDNVQLSFPFTIAAPDLADWKIYVVSPDATLQVFEHEHIWSEIRESLPSGMTLAAKLTAIEAAIGIINGDLTINASQITSLIEGAQIDLTSLTSLFASNPSFVTALTSVLNSSTNVQETIATFLSTSDTFATTLETLVTSSTTIVDSLAESLTENNTFTTFLDERLIAILTGTAGALPAGTQPMLVPAFNRAVPPAREITGGSITETLGTEGATQVSGGNSTVTTRPASTTSRLKVASFGTLSPSILAADAEGAGELEGVLPATATYGSIYTVGAGGAESLTGTGRRGQSFAPGALIAFAAGHWYEVVALPSDYHAVENEMELAKLHVTAAALYAGTAFSAVFPIWLKLASDPRQRINASASLILEKGTRTGALASISWAALATVPVVLADALALTELSLLVNLSAAAAYTASVKVNGKETSTPTFTGSDFSLRVRLSLVDFEDAPATPRGSLIVKMTAARAGIAPLT